MNVVQFTPAIRGKSGREYMMERISKKLDIPIYVIQNEQDSNKSDVMRIATDYRNFMESVKNVRNLDLSDKPIVENDVVIAHSILGAEALKDEDVTVVLMSHGFFKEFTVLFEYMTNSIDSTHEFFIKQDIDRIRDEMKELLEGPDIVVANSKYVKRQLDYWFDVDSVIIPDMMDWEFFHPIDVDNDDYFLSVGRQWWLKQPEVKLKAFSELDENLHIVGGGPYSEEVRHYASRQKNVTYHGYVDKKRLREMYNKAQATVHTSLSEDCPTVVRESLSCGTPVLSTDNGPAADILSHNTGVVFDSENPVDGLKEAVQSFDCDRFDSQKMRRDTERYSAESVANRIDELIQNI